MNGWRRLGPVVAWVTLAFSLPAGAAAPSLEKLVCPSGMRPIAGEACLAAPHRSDGRVLVYFHGMARSPWRTWVGAELSAVVGAALPRGITVVALRGEKGLCDWSADALEHWCWPNDLRQVGRGRQVLARLQLALGEAGRWAGRKLKAPYFAGFSNGGFFVALLMSDLRPKASGFGVLHGGNLTSQAFSDHYRAPTLLVGARGDEIQFPRMTALRDALREHEWDFRFVVREGHHEVTPADAHELAGFIERHPAL